MDSGSIVAVTGVVVAIGVGVLTVAAQLYPERVRGIMRLGRRDRVRASASEPKPLVEKGVEEAVGGQEPYPSGAIAVAIVTQGHDVLMVHRQDESEQLTWLFPSGQMNDGETPGHRAEREVFTETGVSCRAIKILSRRDHPTTGKHCIYVMCSYLSGTPENRDPQENRHVKWVSAVDVVRHVTSDLDGDVRAFLDTLGRKP